MEVLVELLSRDPQTRDHFIFCKTALPYFIFIKEEKVK